MPAIPTPSSASVAGSGTTAVTLKSPREHVLFTGVCVRHAGRSDEKVAATGARGPIEEKTYRRVPGLKTSLLNNAITRPANCKSSQHFGPAHARVFSEVVDRRPDQT
jgi:hypothetical protein